MGETRPPYHQLKVGHLIEARATVGAICFLCGHEGPIDAAKLIERHGQHERLLVHAWLEKPFDSEMPECH